MARLLRASLLNLARPDIFQLSTHTNHTDLVLDFVFGYDSRQFKVFGTHDNQFHPNTAAE